MKAINFERLLFVLGLISVAFTIVRNFDQGFFYWCWPLGCAFWILTCWIKTEKIDSLTKKLINSLTKNK